MSIIKYECGCMLHSPAIGPPWIEFCPLHESAPDLLKACQKVVNNWDNLHPKDRQQLKAAIAKATKEAP